MDTKLDTKFLPRSCSGLQASWGNILCSIRKWIIATKDHVRDVDYAQEIMVVNNKIVIIINQHLGQFNQHMKT